jgi:hypothetical protein
MKNLINILKKEIITMRTLGVVFLAAMLVVVCSVSAEAAVTDRTASVAASGSITGTTSMSVTPLTVTYGTTSANAYPTVPSSNKIVITYSSNYNPWKMMVYTNNTNVPNNASPDGRYAKGGLATTDGKAVVPVKWVAKIGTNATAPALPTTTTYNFVKDKRDEDDPATASADESWATAFSQGYPNIAYGGPGGGFCVDPTNAPSYQGDAVTASSGVSLYLAAGWGTSYATPSAPAGAGSYSTNFVIELYHE